MSTTVREPETARPPSVFDLQFPTSNLRCLAELTRNLGMLDHEIPPTALHPIADHMEAQVAELERLTLALMARERAIAAKEAAP